MAGARSHGGLGQLEVSSHCLMAGYHRRPEGFDAEAFRDGWYRTGDLGYVAEGEVFVVGRKKDLIITGGRNVHPHDLEAIVSEVPGVHPGRVVAFGVTDEGEGTELVVVAEVDDEDPARRHSISAAIRRALVGQSEIAASYVDIVPPGWLLKTSSGKIARDANRRKWLAEHGLPSLVHTHARQPERLACPQAIQPRGRLLKRVLVDLAALALRGALGLGPQRRLLLGRQGVDRSRRDSPGRRGGRSRSRR